MFAHAPVVFVASSLRTSLQALINDASLQAQFYDDAETLLEHLHAAGPACLVLDLQLPDIDGLQLQSLLAERVPVRQLRQVVEALLEHGAHTQDPALLTAAVRTRVFVMARRRCCLPFDQAG